MIQNNKIYSFASVTVTVTLHSNGLFLIQVLLFSSSFYEGGGLVFYFFRLNKSLTGVRKVGRDPPTPRNKTFWGEDYLHFFTLIEKKIPVLNSPFFSRKIFEKFRDQRVKKVSNKKMVDLFSASLRPDFRWFLV